MNRWLVNVALNQLEQQMTTNPNASELCRYLRENRESIICDLMERGEVSLPTPIGRFRLDADSSPDASRDHATTN